MKKKTLFFGLIALLWMMNTIGASATDLVVNGTTVSIAGGDYENVIVKNSGTLKVTGSLTAQNLTVVTLGTLNVAKAVKAGSVLFDGTVTVSGNLSCSEIIVQGGTTTFLGVDNFVTNTTTVVGQLVALGTWDSDNIVILNGGAFKIYPNDSNVPKSGLLFIHAKNIDIQKGGSINGDSAGNDPRGKGHDWYSNCSGGGGGGPGGRGYWNSSGGGNEGQAFGSAFTYESFMGGAGGYYGGGGLLIEAEESLIINGNITANGTTSSNGEVAGGAGGGILIRSLKIVLNGKLSANGGNGIGNSGGGGGGRIKIFYNGDIANLNSHVSVLAGTPNAGPGTIYRDFIPRVTELVAPLPEAMVTNGSFSFRFTVEDLSGPLDGRPDTISPVIEMSSDGFKTIAYRFDQNEAVAGWSKILYYSGDTVEYVPRTPIKMGTYAWRVMVADGSLSSRYTAPRNLAVDTALDQTYSMTLYMTPTIVVRGTAGSYRIDWVSSLDESTNWSELTILKVESEPAFYFDTSAIGEPKRFYRTVLLQ